MDYPNSRLPVILLIDDDQILHLWAARNLPKDHFNLISCYNGKDGIEAFKTHSPDIVLIDIEMPAMNGIETCAEIRALSKNADTQIIMMTVTEDHQKIAQSYAVGAADFVIKPINWKVLRHRLDYMLKANDNRSKLTDSENKLSKANRMAHLAHWEWNLKNDAVTWSDELFSLIGLNKDKFDPTISSFKRQIHQDDVASVTASLNKAIDSQFPDTIEFRLINTNGQTRFVSQVIEPVLNNQFELMGLSGTLQDITERKNQENQIRQLAYYDDVTHLPNRVFFLKFLAKNVDLARRGGRNFAVLILNLDEIKGIRESYGQPASNALLKELSNRLTKSLRCSDLASRFSDYVDHEIDVARLSGDEFIVLLNDITRPEDAAIVAQRIQHAISSPIRLGDRQVHASGSIGIAVFPFDGEYPEILVKHAEDAMNHAQRLGIGRYQFFHEGMAQKAKKRLEMETYMFQAVSNNELRLYYQPVININSGELIGAEALLRWQNPHLGFLPPGDFIPLAEETGVMAEIGEWVIREVCKQCKTWEKKGLGNLTVSINLSRLQFNQSSFISAIKGILEEYAVNPAVLTFELTESMIMADGDNLLKKLIDLKKLGINLALDDFGAGFSSLRSLKRLPLDILKIDRSLVKELPVSSDSAAIVNGILALAKALNLSTVAEGVETAQQKTFLQSTTCQAVQGYFFSKPMPVNDFHKYWEQCNRVVQ